MPLYEFQCSKCGYIEETVTNYEDSKNAQKCPSCEVYSMVKLPSAPGGYHIHGANGASSRPKRAGAFRGRK